ncbi:MULTISPECIES: aminopeptidase N [unclassified Acinetobacter]|uniref:aminopeptidase N n=1 Tax=unclassified Acinetobacter TaxID=196816 RepID=UPI0035B76D9D
MKQGHGNSIETIYLKDYTPPAFQVQSIDLDIALYEQDASVTSTLQVKRQHQGDLVLFGVDLDLQSIQINEQVLQANQYQLDSEKLVLTDLPEQATIKTVVKIKPHTNTHLEGLYLAGDDLFVTQNEPEGFRKITFYPDRPDVLSRFTTRLEADKKYPTLLANGNLLEKGELENGRHYAIWQDPTQKPSYLFACVIGDLAVLKDQYTTSEGRDVALEIYAEPKDIAKCHIAMQALKHSMRWDEEHYGLPYDLDNYMIVATSAFNMGAMENKGLNIFNTSCVLADEEYTTDMAIMRVQSVIAHEYFHNWTGNRITCRDWFQLCLKEGLTVFRDQSFSEDLQSAAVQRIDDVSVLKSHQFPEDAGPLAHPPRPDHFVEINNFYTATVYEKGAEISRMMATLLGKEKFRQGTDKYFELFDGQAVTVEDWVSALSQGSGVDLSGFLNWYNQPHTPTLSVQTAYDADAKQFKVQFKQSIKPHDKYPNLKAVPIPVALALFDKNSGEQLTLNCIDLQQDHVKDGVYLLNSEQAEITFNQVEQAPIISLLRNFSAPVNLDFAYDDADLAFLIQHENNGFNQWQATQTLLERILLADGDLQADNATLQAYLNAMQAVLPKLASSDPLLASRLLDIPSESYLASLIDSDYQPETVKAKRDSLVKLLVNHLKGFWKNYYEACQVTADMPFSQAMGVRALRNICLNMLIKQGDNDAFALAYQQYNQAKTMTERLGAMRALVWANAPQSQDVLNDFYQRFSNEDLVIDQWFSTQAGQPNLAENQLASLVNHADYDINVPNRIRAVTGGLSSRPVNMWSEMGVRHFIELAAQLDEKNPIMASRLIQALSRWYTLQADKREQVKVQLQGLQAKAKSKNLLETVNSLLDVK